jgi:4-hydroxy-2-oxoheptanedioate aldolase
VSLNASEKVGVKLGVGISYPSPGAVERIAPDWDWVWLCAQHGQLAGYDTMLAMVRACHSVNREAFVRVPGQESSWIGLALDMDADAVIVPQIDTPEQASAAAKAAKFPPLGDRSFGGRRVIDRQGRGYYRNANSQSLLICQIESPLALENADAILNTPGVDALFLGPDDYLLRQGIAIDCEDGDELIFAALRRLGPLCQNAGKGLVCIGMRESIFFSAKELGATHLVGGTDVAFLAGGSKSASHLARERAAQPVATGYNPQSASAY